MKKFFISLFSLFICLGIQADDYKILQINTSDIVISGHPRKPGYVFSDVSEIHWKTNQAIKVQNLRTKEIMVFVGNDFKAKKSTTIKDYIFKKNQLSSRHTVLTLRDLSSVLEQTHYLVDTLRFDSPVPLDENHNFHMRYTKNGTEIDQPLPSDEDSFMIVGPMIEETNEPSNVDEVTYSVYYHSNDNIDDYAVTTGMKIIKLPDFIK